MAEQNEMRAVWKNRRIEKVPVSDEELEILRAKVCIWVAGVHHNDLVLFYDLCAKQGVTTIGNTSPMFSNGGMDFFWVEKTSLSAIEAACKEYNDTYYNSTTIRPMWYVRTR